MSGGAIQELRPVTGGTCSKMEMTEAKRPLVGINRFCKSPATLLFLASTAALYFELVVIRYLASEIRVFAYLKNMPLIASFFGIGLGMILGRPTERLRSTWAILAALMFLLVANARSLHLTHVPMPTFDYWQFTFPTLPISLVTLVYVFVVLYFLALIIVLFTVLGGFVGERLVALPKLKAYGVNLLGSLVGVAVFTFLSFLQTPPWIWLAVGFLLLLPFFLRDIRSQVILFLVIVGVALSEPAAIWSPYYRIEVREFPPVTGWSKPAGYLLSVDYDYFQKMLDLSPEFISSNPGATINQESLPHYELPYRLFSRPPQNVLIVGSGTGNDVAAALRHGASHVDAVEIDPLILELGRLLHPEQPYASSRVTAHNDDARAFFRKTKQTYDLIVFGYLDSHTMLSAYSSVRLENSVYTVESLQAAKHLLRPGGTMILAFAAGRSFVTTRLYRMLTAVFEEPPTTYWSGYDSGGVVFIEGNLTNANALRDFPEIGGRLRDDPDPVVLATDQWPFLFLSKPRIPVSILLVLLSFLAIVALICRSMLRLRNCLTAPKLHMFFLGAGFLLLETKGVTELSLLIGGTWITNTIVISAFIVMAMAANVVVMFYSVPFRLAYGLLFISLAVAGFFPYAALDILAMPWRILAAGTLVACPVFFSGLIFSRSFRSCSDPAQFLGMNLFGAAIGGALESLVMVGGLTVLGLLALVLYALAAASLTAQEGGRAALQS
jgi:spermidine synthase